MITDHVDHFINENSVQNFKSPALDYDVIIFLWRHHFCDVTIFGGSWREIYPPLWDTVLSNFASIGSSIFAPSPISTYFHFVFLQIHVTSSFRKSGQRVEGAIVTPARRSNHFVGHAIDINAIDGGKWCNSRCLQSRPAGYSGVTCFINKIKGDPTLRWGGDFRTKDPVHIDDGLNLKDRPKYDKLYNELQKNCN